MFFITYNLGFIFIIDKGSQFHKTPSIKFETKNNRPVFTGSHLCIKLEGNDQDLGQNLFFSFTVSML